MPNPASHPPLAGAIHLDPDFTVGEVNPRLFGSFVEHLGRCVYTGIFEPGHPTADEDGLRTDVLDLIRELGVTMVRYPGRQLRLRLPLGGRSRPGGAAAPPARPRLADRRDEPVRAQRVHALRGARPASSRCMAVNLGTRGVAGGTRPPGVRQPPRRHRPLRPAPLARRTSRYGIRLWCLGNEMDGPWQPGHKTADEYGRLAAETAQAMRDVDPGLELVACGSSSRSMPTFGAWEATVLEHTYDLVDYISCHAYYEESDGDIDSFLASAADMESFIDGVVATADHVGAKRQLEKRINLSFDEWNVWYQSRPVNNTDTPDWSVAPAPARGRLHRHRRRRGRQPADHPAAPLRPRHRGLPRPARQRHRPDHDRARRPGLAADHLLPLRPGGPPRPRPGAPARAWTVPSTTPPGTARCPCCTPPPSGRRTGRSPSSPSTGTPRVRSNSPPTCGRSARWPGR